MSTQDGVKIVVLGGGTGSFTLLSALKKYTNALTAIVNMSDNGGSTGVLRDEYGVLPPGDVRQCLVALSDFEQARDLFTYRFETGTMQGHPFGNLFLTAAEQTTGSFIDGVRLAEKLLQVRGTVLPVTDRPVTLVAKTLTTEIVGECEVATADFSTEKPKLALEPKVSLYEPAKAALLAADLIVIAPGHLYGSLAPTLLVKQLKETLKKCRVPVVYVTNLVTKPGQTDDYTVKDFADAIETFIGEPVLTHVLYNTRLPDAELLQKYAKHGEHAVQITGTVTEKHWQPVGADLLSASRPVVSESDPLKSNRTLIRHDGDKVARSLLKIYFGESRY